MLNKWTSFCENYAKCLFESRNLDIHIMTPLRNIYQFVCTEFVWWQLLRCSITGLPFAFSQLQGKVLLIVNTASACGLTPQYKELQELYEKYRERGFSVVAFPCNQFLSQESGSAEEIQRFVKVWSHVPYHGEE